jgi:hypothetical protein
MMFFKNYRRRRWNAKLRQAQEEANAVSDIIAHHWIADRENAMLAELIIRRGRIGKYSGLLELSDGQLDDEIKKILDRK